MEEEMGDLRGAIIDEFSLRVSSDDNEREKDGVEVILDFDDEEEEEEFDSDSGMGSDDFDLLEVGGESGTEFCQVGDQTCSVPLELYDLSNLSEVLSLDVWNECLSKDEKFSLCKYLPDMDQATFMRTLKDLLSDSNIYFGNPVSMFFKMLKGGLCEPSVSLHHQGLMFFQKQQYYHFLRNYQNNMVSGCLQIKEVWSYCNGQSVQDQIKFLNDMRKQKRIARENVPSRSLESDSSGKDKNPREPLWNQRMMYRNGGKLKGRHSLEFSNHIEALWSPKVFPKLMGTIQTNKFGHDSRLASSMKDRIPDRNDTSGIICDASNRRDRNLFNRRAMEEIGLLKLKKKKKHEDLNADSFSYDTAINPELALKKNMLDIKVMRSELHRKGKYPEMVKQSNQDAASMDFYYKDDRNAGRKKEKLVRGSPVLNMEFNGTSFSPMSDAARNDDTESDSSDLRGGAYGYHLKDKLDYVQPGEACGIFIENNVIHHKKRKTRRVSPFEVATSSKKSVNLNDSLTKVDNRASKIKRKAHGMKDDGYHFVRNSENQCFSHDHTVHSNGLATLNCRLGNNCSSLEFAVEEDDALLEAHGLVEDVVRSRLNKGKNKKTLMDDMRDNSNTPMLRCSSVKKKSKGRKGGKKLGKYNDAHSASLQPVESGAINPIDIQPSDTYAKEIEMMNVEPDPTPQRKTFTLITPTVDYSFMFSVMHLLSAVRIALITPCLEDTLEIKHEIQEAQSRIAGEISNGIHPNESIEGSNSVHPGQGSVPTFSIQEIVNRVRLNPGDPCILETPEPLLDLVRGVLKIFSSKLAPLGAKGWKPIAKYERSSKSWSWIGPLNRTLSDTETIEEVTSPDSWGLPHRMLVKLVDAFAIWLKNSQETLREIGRLPPPPASLMQFNIDVKDRLKDLRAQKSLSTISPSTEEVRDYFRKEEYLRYSIPDRAFTYTAADGKKSTVAPLRRGGGKPSAKARDHFMLKSDRPPHVTILCLVRDAAARLPGSIGTRADVCTLIRDSQYIAEDVTDNQVTQILSGALDRLHYEQDPCVRFEQERKLWVYLHRDRDEEDFDEDGTLSTKKWKKPKKEATDQATDVAVDGQQTVDVVAVAPQLDLVSYQSAGHHNQEDIRDNPEFNGAF